MVGLQTVGIGILRKALKDGSVQVHQCQKDKLLHCGCPTVISLLKNKTIATKIFLSQNLNLEKLSIFYQYRNIAFVSVQLVHSLIDETVGQLATDVCRVVLIGRRKLKRLATKNVVLYLNLTFSLERRFERFWSNQQ
jgi:hypothetical protein